MTESRILCVFTRTPLHVGAGASIGAIDQPIVRERHTRFPVIPGSSLKGSFADMWEANLGEKGNLRVTSKQAEGDRHLPDQVTDAAWLFGSNNDKVAFTGALQFTEARLLAFPIRSARGSFAWITCPVILRRAVRDSVIDEKLIEGMPSPTEDEAVFAMASAGHLALGDQSDQLVLEDYAFKAKAWNGLGAVAAAVSALLPEDKVWAEVKDRLVIVNDGLMSFFCENACEVAQHVRISDETGTAEEGALFNQENVPSETFFYGVVHGFAERTPKGQNRRPSEALAALGEMIKSRPLFQFGADASTGLGFCTLRLGHNGGEAHE